MDVKVLYQLQMKVTLGKPFYRFGTNLRIIADFCKLLGTLLKMYRPYHTYSSQLLFGSFYRWQKSGLEK